MKYSNILFDLDGTITDSKIGIINSIKQALSNFNIQENDTVVLNQFLRPPLLDSFKNVYKLSESDARLALTYYREYYSDKGIFENELFPGIIPLLEKLTNDKKTIYMATSKPTVYAKEIARHFRIGHYFRSIYGSNIDGSRSDKTEIIKYLMATENIDPAQTIMIGDRKHDMIGAKNNGIDSIGVVYGYGGEQEMKETDPTYIIHTTGDLYRFFEQ